MAVGNRSMADGRSCRRLADRAPGVACCCTLWWPAAGTAGGVGALATPGPEKLLPLPGACYPL